MKRSFVVVGLIVSFLLIASIGILIYLQNASESNVASYGGAFSYTTLYCKDSDRYQKYAKKGQVYWQNENGVPFRNYNEEYGGAIYGPWDNCDGDDLIQYECTASIVSDFNSYRQTPVMDCTNLNPDPFEGYGICSGGKCKDSRSWWSRLF